MTQTQSTLQGLLADAFSRGEPVDPATLPLPSVADAYAVQEDLFRRGGYPLTGFKLSLREGVAYSAPLLFLDSCGESAFKPGTIVEPELALTLGADLPPREKPYSRDDVHGAIAKVSLGVEIARSRLLPGAAWPLGLADFLSNVGYLVGETLDPSLLAAEADLGAVRVTSDGHVLVEAAARHPDGDPLAALVAYANGAPGPLGSLKAGQVITTGSLCGAVRVPSPSTVAISLAGARYELRLS